MHAFFQTVRSTWCHFHVFVNSFLLHWPPYYIWFVYILNTISSLSLLPLNHFFFLFHLHFFNWHFMNFFFCRLSSARPILHVLTLHVCTPLSSCQGPFCGKHQGSISVYYVIVLRVVDITHRLMFITAIKLCYLYKNKQQ